MAVKYFVRYKDFATDSDWRVEISKVDYSGDPIEIRSTSEGCVFNYSPVDVDNVLSHKISCKASIVLYNQENNIDVEELQNAGDQDFVFTVYRNSVIIFQGFFVPDGVVRSLTPNPNTVSLSATDGLNLLENQDFFVTNGAMPPGVSNRSPLAHIRDVLYYSLKIRIPIFFKADVLQGLDDSFGFYGSTNWSYSGDSYTKINGDRVTCQFVLEEMLKSFKAQIVQTNGRWLIKRHTDIAKSEGVYQLKGITFENQTEIITEDIEESLPIQFINNNQQMRILPPLKFFESAYIYEKPENVLPNGNFEKTVLGSLAYWSFGGQSNTFYEITQSISAQGENSVRLAHFAESTSDYASFSNGIIPIDTEVLYKTMNIGLTFSPVNGFNFDPSTGIIDFSSRPLLLRVSYETIGGLKYLLNGFGFWVRTYPGPVIPGSVSFTNSTHNGNPAFTAIKYTATLTGHILAGSRININIEAVVTSSGDKNVALRYSTIVQESEEGNRNALMIRIYNELIAGNPYPFIWSFDLSTNSTTATININTDFNTGFYTASPTAFFKLEDGQDTLGKFGAINLEVEGMKIGDIARIDFNAKQDILLPNQNGWIQFEVVLEKGQSIILDDVTMSVPDSNEVFKVSSDITKNSKSDNENIYISSARTGFQRNNYMDSYHDSDEWMNFVDGEDSGTLTQLSAVSVMRQRSTPNDIIDCDMMIPSGIIDLAYTYTFGGNIFVPLSGNFKSASSRFEGAVLGQLKHDSEANLIVERSNTNDKQLSN